MKSWVDAGEVQRDQAQKLVNDIVDRAKVRRERLVSLVDEEVRATVQRMGLASQKDVKALEKKVAKLERGAKKKAPAKKKAAAKKK